MVIQCKERAVEVGTPRAYYYNVICYCEAFNRAYRGISVVVEGDYSSIYDEVVVDEAERVNGLRM